MVNPSSYRTRNAVRRGALGLALALPLLTTLPARAQAEADSDQSSEEQIQLEDALTGDNTESQSAPQAVEVEAFEGIAASASCCRRRGPASAQSADYRGDHRWDRLVTLSKSGWNWLLMTP